MNNDNLTKEQWINIAENLAKKLSITCYYTESCTYCTLPCTKDFLYGYGLNKATYDTWIEQVKKELGYE